MKSQISRRVRRRKTHTCAGDARRKGMDGRCRVEVGKTRAGSRRSRAHAPRLDCARHGRDVHERLDGVGARRRVQLVVDETAVKVDLL
jgi:hypothetical protein